MVDIFSIVFPIFGLIALGYGLVTFGILPRSSGAALSKFVFILPIPLLIFRALATNDPTSYSPWALWATYFGGIFLVWVLSMGWVRFVFGRTGPVLVVAGISGAFSNLVLLGIPIVSGRFGDEGLVPLLLVLSVHLPIMMLTSTVLMEWYGRDEGAGLSWTRMLMRVGQSLGNNPIIWGIGLGGVWGVFGFPIPDLAMVMIDKIVPTAVPLALISMGMGLEKYGLRGNILPGFGIALFKTFAFPFLVFLLASYVFALPPVWASALILAASAPTGINAYLIADHFEVGHGVAANTITLSVLIGLFSLPFWINFVG